MYEHMFTPYMLADLDGLVDRKKWRFTCHTYNDADDVNTTQTTTKEEEDTSKPYERPFQYELLSHYNA